MLKKARDYMKFDSQIDKGIEILPTEFFVVELGIPEDEIMNFVYFCAESPTYSKTVLAGNHLGLMEIYYHNAPLFLEQLGNKNQD